MNMMTTPNGPAAIANLKLEVLDRRTDDLRQHPRTPRKHSERQIKKLVDGIKGNGFVVPVLVVRDLRVLDGHARLTAAPKLGMTTVSSICLDHLDDVQTTAFMLADYRANELSSWDDQVLGEILLDLSLQTLDFSLELTDFDMGEIDLRIEGLDPPGTQAKADRTIKEATVKSFYYKDCYQLRRHMDNFVSAYNFAGRLKTLRDLTLPGSSTKAGQPSRKA